MFGLFSNKKQKQKQSKPLKRQKDFTKPKPIADYFYKQTGVNFDKQISILTSKLSSFCTLRDIDSFSECLLQVKASPALEQELIDYLTTNETYFYREFAQIENLVKEITAQTKKVDILCAPCSTGEEPYSIAIALVEAGVALHSFSIVGIDINSTALSKAKNAIFRQRNLSKMPNPLVAKYFNKQGEKYHLTVKIKNQITFKHANLFDSNIQMLGKFDYVMSRNMLIYFDMETKKRASDILQSLLKDSEKKVMYGHADLY